MGILNEIDTLTGRDAAPDAPVDAGGNSFSRGLRSGMTSAGGQLRALAGGIGEALGADQFAKEQYAKSLADQREAQAQAPEINSFDQVTSAPDLMTGLRRAGSYAAGQLGQAVPLVGAGLAAGGVTAMTGGGALPAFLAATAATTPFTTGGAIEQQQADPEISLRHGAGARLASALTEGGAQAALSNAVPMALGGKLAGRIVEDAVAKRFVPAAVENTLEGVAGNAAAGAASEKVHQTAADLMNPNRDTSGDDTAMKEAAISGAVVGAPFAALGTAGAMRGKAPLPGDSASLSDLAASARDYVKSKFNVPESTSSAPVDLSTRLDDLKSTLTPEPVTGDDHAVQLGVPTAPAEQHAAMFEQADAAARDKALRTQQRLTDHEYLSPQEKEQAAGIDPATPEGQQQLSTLNATAFERQVKAKNVAELADTVTSMPLPETGAARSEVQATPQEFYGMFNKPEFDYLAAPAKKGLADALPRIVALAESGDLPDGVMQRLSDTLGKDTVSTLERAQKLVGNQSPAARDKFAGALLKLRDSQNRDNELLTTVREALPDHLIDSVKTPEIKAFVDKMKSFVMEDGTKDMTPNEQKVYKAKIDDAMQQMFGDKYEAVNEAFAKWATDRAKEQGLQPKDGASATDETVDQNGPDALAEQEMQPEPTRYYGTGNDPENPGLMLHRDEHAKVYPDTESAHERLLRQATGENPDHTVDWMPAQEYAREKGIDPDTLNKMTNGQPEKYGLIAAAGRLQSEPETIGWKDLDAMQLGRDFQKTGKRTKSADLNSPSRIDTGTHGVILDARRIVEVMKNRKVPYENGETEGSLQRLRHLFEAGMAAVTDHLGDDRIGTLKDRTSGEPILTPDGKTQIDPDIVVAHRNGKNITYGDLQKLPREGTKSFDKPPVESLSVKENRLHTANETVQRTKDIIAELENKQGRSAEEARAFAEAKKLLPEYERAALRAEDDIERFKAASLAENIRNGNIEDTNRQNFDASRKAYKKAGEEVPRGLVDDKGTSRISEDNTHVDALLNNGEPTPREFDEAGNPIKYATPFKLRGPDALLAHLDKLGEQATSAAGKEVVRKARTLFDNYHYLTDTHQKELLKASKAESISGLANIVNDLHARYGDKPTTTRDDYAADAAYAKWARSFAADPENLETNLIRADRLQKLGDIKTMQKAVSHLTDVKKPNETQRSLIAAYNDRISKMLAKSNEGDGTLAYKMLAPHAEDSTMESKGATGSTTMNASEIDRVAGTIKKLLGDSVDLRFEKMSHAGDYTMSDDMAKGLLRVSVHALDPQSVAYHESWHALLDQMRKEGLHDVARITDRAAKSADVMNVLRERFKNEPAVRRQIEESSEERSAYMFQLFAAGDKDMARALGTKPKNVITKVVNAIKAAMGIWTNNERALNIMQHFQSGEYTKSIGDRNAISRALIDPGRNKTIDHLNTSLTPMKNMASAFLTVGSERVRDFENPALNKIVDLTRRRSFDEGADPGYMAARRIESHRRKNTMMQQLHKVAPEATSDDYNTTLTAMRMKNTDSLTPVQRRIHDVIRDTLDDTFSYMRAAKVPVKDYGFGKDYAPRMWDTALIAAKEPEFRAMIQKYVDAGSLKGDVEGMINRMMGNDGGELTIDTGGAPSNKFIRERVLKMVSPEDAEPFMEKNALRTLGLYIDQATRRAEWSRRFDAFDKETGEHIPNGELNRMMELAKSRHGATPEQLEVTQKYLDGLNGTLGENLSPKARKVLANTMIYQNLRLLPLGIFSAAIDANGIMVNGGTVGDSFKAFVRGVKDIKKNFEKMPQNDAAYQFAEDMGVIESVMLHHAIGGTTFGLTHASPIMRKANDLMFRFNGMEQWNTSMRVGATQAGVNFISRHADGKLNAHSMRYLAELGLRPSDIAKGEDGRALFRVNDLLAAGVPADKAAALSNKMTFALNKWVDGAVLRPDASIKPIWMNDPHYQLFGHMKQFMFAFQETTLKRVMHEANYGNYGPTIALASFIPVMLAADATKALIQGGGSVPQWQQDWDLGDYFGAAVQRSGLFGVGQLGVDAYKSVHHGGYGVGAIGGPAVGQLGDILLAAEGARAFQSTAIDAMPANSLWGSWFSGKGGSEAPTQVVSAD